MENDNFVKCRDGKEREVFPALIKDKNRIRHFATKFRSDMAIMNIISPDLDAISKAEQLDEKIDELNAYTDEPYNAMLEILVMAFGYKYSKEEIEEFVDVEMIPTILEIFFGISGYKKKVSEMNLLQSLGANLPQV